MRMDGDLLSENTFAAFILYVSCFAACISSPLNVPKGSDTTPTVTTVVQIKHSLYLTFHLLKYLLTTNQVTAKLYFGNMRKSQDEEKHWSIFSYIYGGPIDSHDVIQAEMVSKPSQIVSYLKNIV